MVDRLMAILLLWGMRGALAWYVAFEYSVVVNDKLAAVARALNGLH